MKGCKGLAGWLCGLSFAVMAAPQDDAPVSLAFHDAPIALVLQALADHQQLNLVTAEAVSGTLTLRLEAVPWRQALAVILRMGKLSMTLDGKVMTVFPAEQAPPPLQTLTQRLHHAEAAAVLQSLQAQRGALLSERGSVMADARTNTLMIRDEASALKLLAGWLQQMDQPLEQVQLAAHIVTIGSEDLHELGVNWGLTNEASPGKALRLDNFSVGLPLERSAISAGFHLARISGRILDLELTALEQENALEIIASPRLVTANQQTASIKQGTEIPYEVSSGASGATSVEFKEAVLGMEVTPKILPDGRIALKLQISQNMPGRAIKQGEGEALAIDKQEIKTQVTVKNGETIVLGGIFQRQSSRSADKVPGLGDVPLLGSLFRRSGKQYKKRELVIFITPTLVKG